LGVCGMGAMKRGGRVVGEGGGGYGGVGLCVCVCLCQGVGVCMYLSNSIRGQVEELEMQEVYR